MAGLLTRQHLIFKFMKSINFSRFRNSDYSLLITQLIAILSKFADEVLSALSIKRILTVLIGRQPDIDLSLDKNRKNPFTSLVETCDQKRDDALDALKYYLLYCTKQIDINIRAAAEVLITTLKTFGWSMQSENNSVQSKQVKSLIAEVENQPELGEALTTCNCAPMFELIKSTQADFDQALEKFNAADARLKTIDPSEEKAWIRETVGELIMEINYHQRKGTNAEVNTIAGEIESLVESLYTNIKARQTRAQNTAESE
jgi:hypothetical protein